MSGDRLGKLIGVGVGPGDPELLTVKAVRLIQNAPVLAYTIDEQGCSCARQTAAGYIRPEQVELPLLFSMSPDRAVRQNTRRESAQRVLEALRSGLDVVYLTEGDALLYSTFVHLLAEMPPEIPVEVCPGISAMSSAAAVARLPLAVEGQTVIVTTAASAGGHIHEWMQQGKTIVLFKVSHRLKDIAGELSSAGLDYKAALVQRVSMDGEVTIDNVEDWCRNEATYFSIVIIRPLCEKGKVA